MDPFVVFLVLMLGVGLGSVATAWATRRPETQMRVWNEAGEGTLVDLGEDSSPESIELFRKHWARLMSTAPDKASIRTAWLRSTK